MAVTRGIASEEAIGICNATRIPVSLSIRVIIPVVLGIILPPMEPVTVTLFREV